MDLKIGFVHNPTVVVVKAAGDAQEVRAAVAAALAGQTAVLEVTDEKGSTHLFASAQLAFVEVGATQARPVGFN